MTGRQEPRGQPHHEETAVKKPWRRERSKLHCTHGNEGHGDLLQSSTLEGSGAVRKYRERSIENGGEPRKGRQ